MLYTGCMFTDPDRAMLGVYPLMMPCPGIVSKLSCPISPRWAARRTRVLIHGPTRSRRRSDRTFLTVGDASFLLDHSGCCMLLSGSMPEGKWRRPQHCKTNIGAYNTVWTLTRLEGLKAPFLSYPDDTFLQTYRVWSSVLWLT